MKDFTFSYNKRAFRSVNNVNSTVIERRIRV